MEIPKNELRTAMKYNEEIELYFDNDQALLEPDYHGNYILSFSSNLDKEYKFKTVDEVLNFRYKGMLMVNNLKDYSIF